MLESNSNSTIFKIFVSENNQNHNSLIVGVGDKPVDMINR